MVSRMSGVTSATDLTASRTPRRKLPSGSPKGSLLSTSRLIMLGSMRNRFLLVLAKVLPESRLSWVLCAGIDVVRWNWGRRKQ